MSPQPLPHAAPAAAQPPDALRERALAILHDTFGYTGFRGRQEEIITHVAGGGDAMVLMPTGGGKSLCYQIPALLRAGVAIVVSPLIALMQDQVDALTQQGVRAAYLNSTQDWDTVRDIENRLFRGDLDLLYIAPERLLGERQMGLVDRLYGAGRLALFAIDEAHCVSQWGHDFRPEYLQLSTLHEQYPSIPRIALTATADAATREEMIQRLGLREAKVFVASFDRPNIRYTVVEKGVGSDGPKRQLAAFLKGRRAAWGVEAGIVYCLSRKKVEETAAWLQGEGYDALPYHAGLPAATRAENQRRFLREDGLIMVATIAFGMGIDKPDVRFVAHLDLPKSLESYYQETGRAGRDGEPAEAWMTYGLQDVALQRARIDDSGAGDDQKRLEAQKLTALLAYCETPRCRRVVLLNYFGEEAAPCGNCDVCLDPPQTWDGTVAAQKFLSAVYRTGQRFGAAHVIDVLRGKATPKVKQYDHDRLTTFGVGNDLDEGDWRGVARQLVAAGFLHADLAEHGALKLTADARPVLKGEAAVEFRRRVVRPGAGSGRGDGRQPGRSGREALQGLSGAAAERFEQLRQWRSATAREQGVPAYVIFHDRTLREIAEMNPGTRGHLAQVPGLGQAKMERYGAEILALLAP